MSKQCLDINQMKHLQKLGLKLKETLLYWARDVITEPRAANYYSKWILVKGKGLATVGLTHWEYIPAYTLQDVLNLLPKTIKAGNTEYAISIYSIHGKWAVDYCSDTGADIQSNECENIVDAAYSRLLWCINQGYVEVLKNGGEK